MAVDKLVDSTQLDADLTSVANAIRTKGGTSAQMAFPAGFVSAVNAIPTGVTPTGTKQISITENGTTTEDVTNYANAEITVNVQGGGGGDYQIAGGTFILAQANPNAYVNVDFEPTHAICFRPISDFAEIASWSLCCVTIPDTSEDKYLVSAARTVNGTLGGNVTFRDMTYIEYSDGKFKFNANYNFLTGVSYYWYCWRENT